jgi:hypothetical protein
MRILRMSLILSMLLLAACASNNARYELLQNASSLKGSNIQTVMAKWGVPHQTLHARNGNSYYVYNTNAGSFYNSTFNAQNNIVTPHGWAVGSGGGYNVQPNMLTCSTILETDSTNTIIATMHKGSNCGGKWVSKQS